MSILNAFTDDEQTKLAALNTYACLSAINNATVTLPLTAITLTCNVVSDIAQIDFDTVTGIMTPLVSDCLTMMCSLNIRVSSAAAKVIEVWIESYNTSTLLWEYFPNSGYKREIAGSAEGGISYMRIGHMMAGTQLRLRALSDSATEVQLLSTTLTNGVVVPSIVFGVKN